MLKKFFLVLSLVFYSSASVFAEEVKIGGFSHFRFSAGKDESDSFAVKRARVKFTENLDRRLFLNIQAEIANTPLLLDAYGEYRLDKTLKIRTGQFKVPMSAEALTPATKQDLINKYRFISQMFPPKCRDIGVMASGEFSEDRVSYYAAVFNGSGPNAADNDDSSFYVARMTGKPFSKFKTGIGFASSHEKVEGASKIEKGLILGSYKKSIAQADLEFKVKKEATLKAECIKGKYVPDGFGIKEIRAEGIGVTGSCSVIPGKLSLAARYERHDPDDSVTNKKDEKWTTLGLNYSPAGKVKLQANYISKKEAKDEADNDTFIVQLQYCF